MHDNSKVPTIGDKDKSQKVGETEENKK